MTRYRFLFLDGVTLVVDAEDCKHYSGHAALTNVVLAGKKLQRLNVGLYGLRCMYPEAL